MAVRTTPLKVKTLDRTMELRSAENRTDSERRPLAVLFGWLQAKKRHINKYGNLYLSKGFDVVTVQVPPSQVLWPRHTQAKISKLLSLLQEISKPSRPIVTHGFSVGGYLYGEMLLKLEQQPDKYADIRSRLVGQVFDSPVDFEGVPRGFSNVLVSNPLLRSTLRKLLETYLKVMQSQVTNHYLQSSKAFHNNSLDLPSLFLYSRIDPIGVAEIIEGVMDKWQKKGVAVSHKCWERTPHVSHFHHHPDQYVEALITFLESLGFFTPEQQELEREKDLQGKQQASTVSGVIRE
ncbi:transmembrane protein 53-like isoform X1 [Pomacea canaliculata]|nr:transmembrane protein 53-like isoform X1 [Pomacea canaliculata]